MTVLKTISSAVLGSGLFGLTAGVSALAGVQDEPAPTGTPPTAIPQMSEEDRKNIQTYGAPICMWMIAVELKAYQKRCKSGDDGNAQALDNALLKIDSFLARNAEIPVTTVQARTANRLEQTLERYREKADACEGEGKHFYDGFTKQGPSVISQWADNVTAVDRPLVADPCL